MAATTMTPAPERGPRYAAVDIVRGLAILGVVVYHFAWDLNFFRYIATDVAGDPLWRGFARLLAGTFLALVGVSLVLAHRGGMRWRAFRRRLAIVAGAALGISLATWLVFPGAFIFFGILHAIALFSVLALPFLRLPVWLTASVALVVLLLPLWVTVPGFETRWLAWIGLVPQVPVTNDYEPLFPWFGVTLSGIVLARLAFSAGLAERVGHWHPRGPAWRALQGVGRWTLVIYLLHQPVLFALLSAVSWAWPPGVEMEKAHFAASCEAGCRRSGGAPGLCAQVCACTADGIGRADLWGRIAGPDLSPEDRDRVALIGERCYADIQAGGAERPDVDGAPRP